MMGYFVNIKSKFLISLTMFAIFSILLDRGNWGWTESKEEELFFVAQKAFDDGFYDIAIRYIDQFLEEYPETKKRIQAQLLLGQCYFFKSQYLKAFDIFQGLVQFSEFQDATLFWLGETYFKGSDFKQAAKHYRQLMDLYPESVYLPQAYYSLAWTYFEENDYKNAKQTFLELIKRFPIHQLSEEAAFKTGECEYNMGSYEIAIQYFKNYVLKYPQSSRQAESYFYIAESYYFLEDYLTAITYYAKAADIAYENKLIYIAKVSMGWSYLKLGKFDLSKRVLEEAQQLAQEKDILTDEVFLGLANLYTAMGDNPKALTAFSELIEKFPQSPRIVESYLGKANCYYALKDYPQALTAYQWIIENYNQNQEFRDIVEKAYYGLAWTYLKSGDIDRSIRSFELIMNQTESKIIKVSALTQIGDAYHDINELDKAIAIYDRILKDYPDSIYTDYIQFRQGIALLKLNRIDAATLSFKTLQSNFPNSKYLNDLKYYLAVAYFKKEDWGQAIHYIQEYLNLLPSSDFNSEAHYILAFSYFQSNDYEKAIQEFQQLLRDYPNEKTLTRISELHIAKCLFHLGQEKEALENFKIVIAKYPESETAHEALLWLGDYYLKKANYEKATEYYIQFLKNFPGSDKVDNVNFELGQIYQAQGLFDKALNQYKTINETADKEVVARAKLAIADIFSQKLDPKTAIETYLNIVESSADFRRDAYMKIAELYKFQMDFEKAIEAYDKALSSEQALSEIRNAELLFSIGDAYELLNDKNQAIEAYFKIPYLYSEETSWIIKSYLRIARIFEEDEKWDDAKSIYNKIIDYRKEESKYAQERIDWIDQNILKRYQMTQ